jgi:outer membrane protein assembly factor BamB/tetratricopeptide (TPR) repeat protein
MGLLMTREADVISERWGNEGQPMGGMQRRWSRQFPVCFAAIGVFAAGLAVLLGGSASGQGQNRSAAKFYPDTSDTAQKLLRTAADHARGKQFSEAIQIYQRVIEQFGDKVAQLPKDDAGPDVGGEFVLFVDGRSLCHRAIAQFPPDAREMYRNRVDAIAERWFRDGASRRDVGLLRRVVDQAFCSSWGDDALELLGDLAFQDGRFGEAIAMYGQLVADRPDDRALLVHPDPSVDLARVSAKKLLCRNAAGDIPPAKSELDDFGRRFPEAAGQLAGRKGTYLTILHDAFQSDHLALPSQPDSRWPTFAGSLTRSKVVPGPIDVGSTQWRVELEKVWSNRQNAFIPRGAVVVGGGSSSPEQLLAFHPIVLGDQVIVCDGTRVLAYNLNDRPADSDGTARLVEPAWKHDPENGAQVPQARTMPVGIPRHTLTAVGHRIYARMGAMSAAFFGGMGGMGGRGASSIIALDWNTQGKLLWEHKSTTLSLPNRPPDRNGINRTVSFEGTPVADARNVYVAVTDRREQTATYIACFDADTGANRWIRYVGAASPDVNNVFNMGMPIQFGMTAPSDFNHRLLSLDGPALYYQTNLGAVVALEADTGAILWVATYPRQEPNHGGNASERDLNPAVVHDGRVFVAPSDADSVFAFASGSGRLLWKSDPITDDVKLSHLLGVAKDRLVATGNRVILFDVKTGQMRHVWPDSGKSLDGYGRGLLAGDLIYWPTSTEIQVLDQRTALRAEPPIKLVETYHTKGGNLVAGDGYLIVAQADGMVVFCQNSRLIERYRDEIAKNPERAASYFRLARAAEAVGRDELALDMYRQAAQKARPSETIDGTALIATARDHRFRLLLKLAGQARKSRRYGAARAHLDLAASVANSDQERLEAQLLCADVLLDAAQPGEAVAICQRLLGDDRLQRLALAAPDGHRTIRADLYIVDRLRSIVRNHGRGVYESFDREAARLYERGKEEKDAHLLELACRRFPVSAVVPDALLELGNLLESSQRLTDAAHAYKRLFSAAPDDEHRALALWRIAHVYEARKLFVAARDSLLDLQARFSDTHMKGAQGDGTVAFMVASELARSPYTQLAVERPLPLTPVPLVRRWQLPAPASQPVKVIAIEGVAPSSDAGRLLLVDKTGVRLLETSSGLPRWGAELGSTAVWAGYLADKLVVGTARQIVALEPAQGTVQWRYDVARPGKNLKGPDPFADAKVPDAPERRERSTDSLTGFQLVKGHVFCLRGPSELIAVDGDTGVGVWSFSCPPAQINPNLLIGADRTILQIDKPNQMLVLRTADGQPISRTALAENEWLQRAPMPVDDDSVILVSDRRTVKRFDLTRGQTVWVYQESPDLPVNGPPCLIGDSERLLVLHDGRVLIRLDAATGSKNWSCPLGVEDLSERPDAMAYDESRFYYINVENYLGYLRQAVLAISLADGSKAWSCRLTGLKEAKWSLALSQRYVISYPVSNIGDGGDVEKLPVLAMPVIVRRRETGQLVQRFVFPTTIADVIFKADSRGAVVASARGLWGLGSKEASVAPLLDRAH